MLRQRIIQERSIAKMSKASWYDAIIRITILCLTICILPGWKKYFNSPSIFPSKDNKYFTYVQVCNKVLKEQKKAKSEQQKSFIKGLIWTCDYNTTLQYVIDTQLSQQGYGTSMRAGFSGQFQRYPTTCEFKVVFLLLCYNHNAIIIIIQSKRNFTWNCKMKYCWNRLIQPCGDFS